LSLYGTYSPVPGVPNASPAAVWIDVQASPLAVRGVSGAPARASRPATVAIDRARRRGYVPDQTRGAFSPYLGQMHSHTLFSDGIGGGPSAAYDMARFQGGLDWFMVSDHLEQIFPTANLPFLTYKWPETRRQADVRNMDGMFVAMNGYEWGNGL